MIVGCRTSRRGSVSQAYFALGGAKHSGRSEALRRPADHTWRGGAWTAASRFFRNPYSPVGRERLWRGDIHQTKTLLINAKHAPVIPLAVAPPQPELVGPVPW